MTSIANCFYRAKRSEIKALCCALLASMLVGCDAPGTARLKELCENEGFPKVYQQVSADGYYDDSQECGDAIRFFVGSDYAFLECRQTQYMPLGPEEFGLYRIRKVPINSGLCDAGYGEIIKKFPGWFKDFSDAGMCFAIEEVDSYAAQYGLFNGESSVINIDNILGSKIVTRLKYIQELGRGDLVAEDKSFMLYPTPGITLSSFQRMLHCNTVVSENRDIPPLNQVDAYIKPEMTNRESSHGNNRGNLSGGTDR